MSSIINYLEIFHGPHIIFIIQSSAIPCRRGRRATSKRHEGCRPSLVGVTRRHDCRWHNNKNKKRLLKPTDLLAQPGEDVAICMGGLQVIPGSAYRVIKDGGGRMLVAAAALAATSAVAAPSFSCQLQSYYHLS